MKVKDILPYLPSRLPKEQPARRLLSTLKKFKDNEMLYHAYVEAMEQAQQGNHLEALKLANRGIIPI
jgi:hypothetical protein